MNDPKPLSDILPDLTNAQPKRIFWNHLNHERRNPTKAEAAELFARLDPIIRDLATWRRYVVSLYLTGQPMSELTAREFVRFESDLANGNIPTTSANEIDDIVIDSQ
jgi:hypothetical protein